MWDKKEYYCIDESWVVPLSELLGKTVIKLEQVGEREELRFFCSDGTVYALYHEIGCSEDVYLEDVNGELEWLLGTPILMAEETQGDTGTDEKEAVRYRWTFYRFATRKGYVNLRFVGTSNGYYSEAVNFIRFPEGSLSEHGWLNGWWYEYESQYEPENEILCRCRWERGRHRTDDGDTIEELGIYFPRWVGMYGFPEQYCIIDLVFHKEIKADTIQQKLGHWLFEEFLPAESRAVIEEAERREAFLGRIRACNWKLEESGGE